MCNRCYERNRNRQKAYGRWQPMLVDAEPVRAHVQALQAAGLGGRRISELSGVSRTSLTALITGRPNRGTGPSRTVRADTAQKLLAIPLPDRPMAVVKSGARLDACGTIRRLQALVAIGWSQTMLCEELGWWDGNATRLFLGKQVWVTASTARKVAQLYDRKSMTAGPNQSARDRAKRKRWAPPLAWDDDLIDDPNAHPDLGQKQTVKFDERFLELRELGYSDLQIVNRLNIQPQSLLRQLVRYHIKPDPELVTEAGRIKHRKDSRYAS